MKVMEEESASGGNGGNGAARSIHFGASALSTEYEQGVTTEIPLTCPELDTVKRTTTLPSIRDLRAA